MLDYNFHLTTSRLYISCLDPSNDAHCDFLFELINSPELATVKAETEQTREDGRKLIADGVENIAKSSYGRYLISLKSPTTSTPAEDIIPFSERNHEPIGVVTMQLARFPGAPTIPDIGFGLVSQHFGKGYATEAAFGLLKYFEEEKGQKEFAGYCCPENEGSKNVFRRLAFEERGVRELNGVIGEGKLLKVLVWTKGVGWGEGVLEGYGL